MSCSAQGVVCASRTGQRKRRMRCETGGRGGKEEGGGDEGVRVEDKEYEEDAKGEEGGNDRLGEKREMMGLNSRR